MEVAGRLRTQATIARTDSAMHQSNGVPVKGAIFSPHSLMCSREGGARYYLASAGNSDSKATVRRSAKDSKALGWLSVPSQVLRVW